MTLIAVPIPVASADGISAALERGAAAVRGGADVIEWRVDELANDSEQTAAVAAAARLVAESPAPCILTCRPEREGGGYEGPERDRLELLSAVACVDPPPRYLDIEIDVATQMARGSGNEGAGVIRSSHDFVQRPVDLLQRVAQLAAEPACDVIKLAWTARSLRDNLEAFELLVARPKPMIALCMGPFGLPSRVLAPKFGALLTFASDGGGDDTAPGQPPIDVLLDRYRFRSITRSTRVYGIVGWPVDHSAGTHVHNAGFEAVGFDGVYLPLPVPPEYEHFKATMSAWLAHDGLDFSGASVTLPHKAHLLRLVTELGGTVDPLAARLGAANTLVIGDDGAPMCTNTDAPGIVDAVRAARTDVAGARIAVLGAGGVARAAAGGLASAGAAVTVYNRTRARAASLASDLGDGIVVGDPATLSPACFDVLINCTAVGMQGGPAPDDQPEGAIGGLGLDFTACADGAIVFDTVYRPRRTNLLERAAAAGVATIGGEALYLAQAKRQFEAWTGTTPPMDVFEAALARA